MSTAKALPQRGAGITGVALRAALIGGLGLGLSACDTIPNFGLFGGDKYKPEIVAEVPAEQLYNQGLGRIENRDFPGAAKRFGDLEKQYPYSDWSRRALIMTSYAHYEAGEWDDAINTSRRYLQLHPATNDAAYAQYLLAMSHYNQIPDINRDQERSEKALAALQELVDRYPKSEYVADARAKIQVARDQLAGREMQVGRFYLEKRNYTGAINRFREVVGKYQTTRHIEEALMRLTESYMALGIADEAQTAAAVLGHNFPDSPWYKDSFTLLSTGGLSPRENEASWISRALRGIGKPVRVRTG